ncbi:3-isopropylmalate dehydratase small subunit [Dactylosporangium matsuzakiense]|uniref:3-isopropylmalate dehydratase small subunit n=1 Tax=Dactylosporangium matsuzakiense TaxID=53360 RepID=A0A9W6KSI8_9ACTN|nr:3-isopropylmalate dehydratase small subunit [Dactylosporangium matsuzakiense]
MTGVGAVSEHTGRAVLLRRDDVDTDQIVAAEYCKRITKRGYEDVLFSRWRQEPGFALNDPAAAGATVLVAGHNFGTGSSREHAVWALRDWGFRAVLATGFGDIFRRNALKNGLLPVQLAPEALAELTALVERDPAGPVSVEVTTRTVRAAGRSWPFPIDERARRHLIAGLDEIAVTLSAEAVIAAHERSRPDWLPVVRVHPAEPAGPFDPQSAVPEPPAPGQSAPAKEWVSR